VDAEPSVAAAATQANPSTETPDAGLAELLAAWPAIVEQLSAHPPTKPLIINSRPVAVDGAIVTLGFPEEQAFLKDQAERRRPGIEAGIAAVIGHPVTVRCVVANVEIAPAGSDDLVAEARRIFADDLADVGEVRHGHGPDTDGGLHRHARYGRLTAGEHERSERMGMGNLQRMAQQMQQEMLRIQAELEATMVDGSAGGGVVAATVTGKQELVSVTIDPSVVDPEDVDMLQDLVIAAVNDALRASRELAEQKMSAVTGGLRLPGM
jgi:DNA-binding YbaB/EbfC family protein